MSNGTEIDGATIIGAGKNPACRVAYSINNYQPVRSTIISEQPIFYMDAEIPYEDDDILYDDSYDSIETDIEELKKKISAYDRLSSQYAEKPDQRSHEFLANKNFICSKETSTEKSEKDFTVLIDVLRQSRLAAALIDHALDHNVELGYSGQIETSFYDREAGKIVIHPNLNEADQILLLARELRRHWQHRQGVLIHPLTFDPAQAILIHRAQEADLCAFMVRIAWELQLAGNKDIWTRVENSGMADLGRALAREAYIDFRTLNNGQATSAVFETWFLSERCRAQDKKLIQAMLADHQGYVFTSEETSRIVSIDLISALGNVPFGKNYLAPHAQMIIQDPVFTDVRDRSNANFLWFIKFERSFKETERELQSDELIHIHDAHHEDPNRNQIGQSDEQESKIYQLPKKGSNIVYVQFCAEQ